MGYTIHFRSYVLDYSVIDGGQPPQALNAVDPVSDELQADTLTFGVIAQGEERGDFFLTLAGEKFEFSDGSIFMLSAGQPAIADLASYDYGEVVEIYDANDALVSKWYLQKIERVAKWIYKFTCCSAVGLLIGRTHRGGVYTGELASILIADIMGSVPYTLSANVQDERLYGRLPLASARDNLHTVLFTLGASVLKDANGDIMIDYLDTMQTPVPDTRIYEGGSVEYQTPVTSIVVIEHGFFALATDEVFTLFDNAADIAPAMSQIIIFDEAYHDLTATGSIVIEESNANYAVVSGIGTMTGKKYTHTRHEYQLATGANGEENEVRIEDVELINANNSYYLAQRLKNFYAANEAQLSIVKQGERAGDGITFTNAFGEASNGYIREATETYSQIVKSDLVVVTDYTPGPFGSNYDAYVILDADQIWTVPAGLAGERVRVVCFGGSRGGQAGQKGQDGQSSTKGGTFGDAQPVAERSAGGAGGAGGAGFMILQADIVLSEASYAIAIGAGGAGGASDGDLGALGGDTSFGAFTSADGVEATTYYNVMAGEMYGETGDAGEAGGYGGAAIYSAPENGEAITVDGVTYQGGIAGSGSDYDQEYYTYSAAGGGAAAGNNGGDAYVPGQHTTIKSMGGPGAAATIVAAQAAGRAVGGKGGYGGGGGGGGGFVHYVGTQSSWYVNGNGTGGHGGPGGQGSNGFVVMFFNSPGGYLTFSAPTDFTIETANGLANWDGKIEYSTDALAWSEWDGTQISSASGILHMRGSHNTYLTGSLGSAARWIITGSNVSILGSIDMLLDHNFAAVGGFPPMAARAMAQLFSSNTALIVPPVMPNEILAERCYFAMFRSCTNLAALPALPAADIPESAYARMFMGCTSIMVAAASGGSHTHAWRLPASGSAGTLGASWNLGMLQSTGGRFSGSPAPETTYYTTAQPVE